MSNLKQRQKHLACCSIPGCKQIISENCSLHVFPNEKDPRRKQWIKILKVEKDVPRHYRICSKHFKPSDFFPRHQLQKKLMLRPTAVPTENLPPEITNAPYVERPDTPDTTSEENSSYSTSLNQSDSNTNPILPINEFTDDNGQLITDNLANHFNYHYTVNPTPAPVQNNISVNHTTTFSTSYEPISLETVPYTELIKDEYSLYDGTEIDSTLLANVLRKEENDEYNNGETITYTISYLDY